MPPPDKRTAGWEDWLHQHGVHDATLSKEDAYRRFEKLHGWTFDAVPQGEWGQFYRDLTLFESAFVVGSALGCVADMPFEF